jgi:hypothetical protein
VIRERAVRVVEMVFAAADVLAAHSGDDYDRALTVCLEAIFAGLQQTTMLTPAESWMVAIDLLLDALEVGSTGTG